MKYFGGFGVIVIMLITMLFGCGDDKFDVVLDNLDRPTYEVAGEISQCYKYLQSDLIGYYLAFDRLCVDMLVSGKTLEELAVDTTVAEILADTDTYNGEYVEIEAYVIFKDENGIVIADVNNDLTTDVLAVIEFETEYIDNLTQGNQYTFMLQVWLAENANGGVLLDEPAAVEVEMEVENE